MVGRSTNQPENSLLHFSRFAAAVSAALSHSLPFNASDIDIDDEDDDDDDNDNDNNDDNNDDNDDDDDDDDDGKSIRACFTESVNRGFDNAETHKTTSGPKTRLTSPCTLR
eukprot:Selendium_serpulae@DN6559_c0_g1_i1.p1